MSTRSPDESESGTSASPETEVPATVAGSQIVSALRAVGTRGVSWLRNSTLYQWLTAEPDPDVIVIDLRDTWTVGPFIGVLDWVISRLFAAAGESRFVAVAQRGVTTTCAAPVRVMGVVTTVVGLIVAGSALLGDLSLTQLTIGVGLAIGGVIAMQDGRDWDTLRETRPVALVTAALEPPEPPATGASNERSPQEDTDPPSLTDDCDTAGSHAETNE